MTELYLITNTDTGEKVVAKTFSYNLGNFGPSNSAATLNNHGKAIRDIFPNNQHLTNTTI